MGNDPLTGVVSEQHERAQAVRRVGGHLALQLPVRVGRRADRRGAGRGQHRRLQARHRYAVVRPPAGRCAPRCRRARGRVQLRDGRRRDGRRSADRQPDVDGITFTGSYDVGMHIYQTFAPALSAPVHRRDGRQESGHRVAPRPTFDAAAQACCARRSGWQGQKCSACSRVYVEQSVFGEVRAGPCTNLPTRSRSAIRPSARTGSARWPTRAAVSRLRGCRLRRTTRRGGEILHGRQAAGRRRSGQGLFLRADARARAARRIACGSSEMFLPITTHLAPVDSVNEGDEAWRTTSTTA